MRLRVLLLAVAICVAAPALARADETVKGKIFDPETGKLLFTYENSRGHSGELSFSHTRYQNAATGSSAVEEDMLYDHGKLKSYKYSQLQTQESGTIEIKDGKVLYSFVEQGKVSKDDEDFEDGMIVPDQLEGLIGKSWKELQTDESVKFRLLLLERQDSIGFKLFRDKEREVDGKAAVDLVMKPSSFFIAAIAPSFRLTVEKEAPHRILETLGRLPVRLPKNNPPKSRGDWKAIDARLVMEYGAPQGEGASSGTEFAPAAGAPAPAPGASAPSSGSAVPASP